MKKLILVTFLILMNCLKNSPLNLNKINYKNGFNNKITKLIEDYLKSKKIGNFKEAENYLQELKDIIAKQEPYDFQEGAIPDLVVDRVREYTLRKISNDKGNFLVKPNYGFENLDNFINHKENYNKFLKSFIFRSWFEIIDLNQDYIEVLLKAGVPINMENSFGENLLHKACYEGDLDLATFLIEKGIDVNKQDRRLGFSPIFFCLKNFKDQSFSIIEKLIDSGASLLIIDNENKTILHHFYKAIVDVKSRNYELYCNLMKFFKISLKTVLKESPEILSIEDNEDENTFYDYFFDLSLILPPLVEIEENSYKTKFSSSSLAEKLFYDYDRILKKNKKSFIDFLVLTSEEFFEKDFIRECLHLYEIKFEQYEQITFKTKIKNLDGSLKIDSLVSEDKEIFLDCLFKFLFNQNQESNLELSSKLATILNRSIIRGKHKIIKLLILDPFFKKFNLLNYIDLKENNIMTTILLNYFIKWSENDLFKNTLLKIININSINEILYEEESSISLSTTFLSNIIKENNKNMFDLIIQRKDLDLFIKDYIGYTCFHYAAEFNRFEMFQKLVELLKIKIQQNLVHEEIDKNIKGDTPLTIIEKRLKKDKAYYSLNNYIESLDCDIINTLKIIGNGLLLDENETMTYYEILLKKRKNKKVSRILTSRGSFGKSTLLDDLKKNEEEFLTDYRKNFPFHYSIFYNDIESFDNLLAKELSSEIKQDLFGLNPLHIAVGYLNEEIIKKFLNSELNLVPLLLENKKCEELYERSTFPPYNFRSFIFKFSKSGIFDENSSPIEQVIDLENLDILNLFLDYMKLKGLEEEFKKELLDYSLSRQKFESFKVIYESLSEANEKNFSQQILIKIIKKVMDEDKNPKIIDSLEFLLKYYLRKNINLNSNENNLLILAIEKENEFLTELLIKYGANPKTKDDKGIPISYYALYKKNKKFITKLFERGFFDINTLNNGTPLHFCIENIFNNESFIDEDFVEFIVKKFKYCVNSFNNRGLLPFHLALFNEKGFEVAQIMINNIVDIKKQDKDGNILLHTLIQDYILNGPNSVSAQCNNKENIEKLIELSDWNIKNNEGISCFDYLKIHWEGFCK